MKEPKNLLEGKTVLIGVTGSIAAYKTPNLVSALVKRGANVHVLMTRNATEFIAPLVFETLSGNRCVYDTFDRSFSFDVEHISLAEQADLVMIAPATANVIAKLAHGICDDMLTTTILACTCPIMISPTMNTHMYDAKITQENMQKLEQLGMELITPESGRLACKTEGVGRMPEPEVLLEHIILKIGREPFLSGKKVLVTAGPTREAIDPVRFITNHSTGRMGYALAKEAAMAGAQVVLVSGEVDLAVPLGVEYVPVVSAEDMYNAVMAHFDTSDIVIKAAAVADFRPKTVATEKIKKKDTSDNVIELERTTDIIKTLGQNKKKQILCGFSMETENLIENSKKKLEEKNLDMIVCNNLRTEGAGFGTDTNVVTLLSKTNEESLPIMSKEDLAFYILNRLSSL